MKTILTHFYNEEYLLPWWLNHHKKYFDHGILIDYHSTDRSVEIIKSICPSWEVVTTRNEYFEALKIDEEVMMYESQIDGWKICLNITEFLYGDYSVLNDITYQHQYLIPSLIFIDEPIKFNYPKYDIELYKQIKHKGFVITCDEEYGVRSGLRRGLRSFHNFNLQYPGGRHWYDFTPKLIPEFIVFYYPFSPYNGYFLDRKLQIQKNIPKTDFEKGAGIQHNILSNNVIDNWRKLYSSSSNIEKLIYEYIHKTPIKDNGLHLESITDQEKLKNFPTINFISLRESENRRKVLYEMFEKCGITKVRPHIFESFDKNQNLIENIDSIMSCQLFLEMKHYCDISKYLDALTSHLKSIKEWYDNTDEPYAIFCEDDLSFDTVKYWNFTWNEFFNILPKNWECIQLAVARDDLFLYFQPEVYLRNRCWDDFSCVCYLITRNHAKNLLDNYYDGNTFYLNYKGSDAFLRPQICKEPIIETLIYTVFKHIGNEGMSVFTFPLFIENCEIQSDVWNNRSIHNMQNSPNEILNWWKTKGKYFSVEDFKKIE